MAEHEPIIAQTKEVFDQVVLNRGHIFTPRGTL
jgi:hypothetical protein